MEECIFKKEQIECIIGEIKEAINNKNVSEAGKEIPVTQNIFSVWEDYLFILNGFLIRWDDCNKYIQDILNHLNGYNIVENCQLSAPMPQANWLSYRFEDLLVAFPRLNEEPLIVEIERYVNNNNRKKIRNNRYIREDAHGLFWELNLLRNRAAHSIKGNYTQHEGVAARYLSISSEFSVIDYHNGQWVFRSNLYSYRNNEFISEIVQDYIIDAKHGDELAKKTLMELLFENTKPKGHGKKKPILLFPSNIEFFDLNSEFYALSNDMLGYIIAQLEVFKSEIVI